MEVILTNSVRPGILVEKEFFVHSNQNVPGDPKALSHPPFFVSVVHSAPDLKRRNAMPELQEITSSLPSGKMLPRRNTSGDRLGDLADFLRGPPPPGNFMSIPDDFSTSPLVGSRWKIFRFFHKRRKGKKHPPPIIKLPDSAVSARTSSGLRHIAISIPTEHSHLGTAVPPQDAAAPEAAEMPTSHQVSDQGPQLVQITMPDQGKRASRLGLDDHDSLSSASFAQGSGAIIDEVTGLAPPPRKASVLSIVPSGEEIPSSKGKGPRIQSDPQGSAWREYEAPLSPLGLSRLRPHAVMRESRFPRYGPEPEMRQSRSISEPAASGVASRMAHSAAPAATTTLTGTTSRQSKRHSQQNSHEGYESSSHHRQGHRHQAWPLRTHSLAFSKDDGRGVGPTAAGASAIVAVVGKKDYNDDEFVTPLRIVSTNSLGAIALPARTSSRRARTTESETGGAVVGSVGSRSGRTFAVASGIRSVHGSIHDGGNGNSNNNNNNNNNNGGGTHNCASFAESIVTTESSPRVLKAQTATAYQSVPIVVRPPSRPGVEAAEPPLDLDNPDDGWRYYALLPPRRLSEDVGEGTAGRHERKQRDVDRFQAHPYPRLGPDSAAVKQQQKKSDVRRSQPLDLPPSHHHYHHYRRNKQDHTTSRTPTHESRRSQGAELVPSPSPSPSSPSIPPSSSLPSSLLSLSFSPTTTSSSDSLPRSRRHRHRHHHRRRSSVSPPPSYYRLREQQAAQEERAARRARQTARALARDKAARDRWEMRRRRRRDGEARARDVERRVRRLERRGAAVERGVAALAAALNRLLLLQGREPVALPAPPDAASPSSSSSSPPPTAFRRRRRRSSSSAAEDPRPKPGRAARRRPTPLDPLSRVCAGAREDSAEGSQRASVGAGAGDEVLGPRGDGEAREAEAEKAVVRTRSRRR
ncbi:hypothetical protein GGS23DRAFT_593077 [Durotheca rogersii]|uniref:uncharacterized protein n=1 Tax=Durotheca rogersii TaxID=419775 RepID=UPI00221F9435|nr:uncharacterized protein GGS23DRAFT_593077 [Durotheca rogersii]KAI5867801.1 hypothetical protein GGS23DRAFT_593077 [Durotheca rogersii]